MRLNPVLELLNICTGRLRSVSIELRLVRDLVICWLRPACVAWIETDPVG
jgi:hypothetical protein